MSTCTARRRGRTDPTETKPVRCAVYTRVSTDERLGQDFNSLDAQREAAEAYIVSQKHEGWTCLPDRYDDGGYSGGSMDRPALKRLLADVEAGRVIPTATRRATGGITSTNSSMGWIRTYSTHHPRRKC